MIALIVETRTKVHVRIRPLYDTKEFENKKNYSKKASNVFVHTTPVEF